MSNASPLLPKPPVGIIDSITSGFEVVNGRLVLALFPLALDVFLWLGPKLSIQPLLPPLLTGLQSFYAYSGDPNITQQFDLVKTALNEFGAQYNVFSALSTAPLGVPSFMGGPRPEAMPAGVPVVTWPINQPLLFVLLFGVLTLAGLFLGALYFGGIAQQVREARLDVLKLLQQVWPDWIRLTVFLVLMLVIVGIVTFPILMVSSLISLFSPLIGAVVSALAVTVIMWLVFYVGFTVQGIVLMRRGLFGAMWDSLRVAQGSFAHAAGLYILVVVINLGLGALWSLASPSSWVMLAALGGHALVSTALVAATFVFYKDRYRWWAEMRQARAALAAKQPPALKKKA